MHKLKEIIATDNIKCIKKDINTVIKNSELEAQNATNENISNTTINIRSKSVKNKN